MPYQQRHDESLNRRIAERAALASSPAARKRRLTWLVCLTALTSAAASSYLTVSVANRPRALPDVPLPSMAAHASSAPAR